MSENDQILQKLRRLQAIKDRPGNEHEAAIAALRIREILDKHNLDIGVLELKEEEGVHQATGMKRKKVPEHWAILATAVKELLDVEFYGKGTDAAGWEFHFMGLKSNVETACLTFEYLVRAVDQLQQDWWQASGSPIVPGQIVVAQTIGDILSWMARGTSFPMRRVTNAKDRRAFQVGCSRRILDEIRLAKAYYKNSPDAGALVHVGNAVAKRMKDGMQFEKINKVEPKIRQSEALAYHLGYVEGAKVDPKKAGRKRIS